jgi:16S rRNA U1498 N3-methylase RsmE
MDLTEPMNWRDYLESEQAPLRILADPGGPASPGPSTGGAALAVGPEGGFTPTERSEADSAGWRRQRFAGHTLRIETAALVGSALLLMPGPEEVIG